MRVPFLPRPSREELFTSTVHMIIQDFPETLADFRAHGVQLDELGHRTLEEFEDPVALLDDLEASTFWRPGLGTA
jgi:hypothetical protein